MERIKQIYKIPKKGNKKKSCHLVPKVVIDLLFEGRKAEGSQKHRRRERVPKVGSRREETIIITLKVHLIENEEGGGTDLM